MHVCNDLHAILGVVFHCELDPHITGDHSAAHGKVTWPQHANTGARWTLRHPGTWLWHRIMTSQTTACGLEIANLTPVTVRGRTQPWPPAGSLVCPPCLETAPWVPLGDALPVAA
jgi:hypothetical protein